MLADQRECVGLIEWPDARCEFPLALRTGGIRSEGQGKISDQFRQFHVVPVVGSVARTVLVKNWISRGISLGCGGKHGDVRPRSYTAHSYRRLPPVDKICIEKTALDQVQEALLTKSYTTGSTHNFYHYPARFPPAIARAIIETFSRPGDVLLDPFMGGGTRRD